jgi:Xaa-Pro dipeptidase
VGGNPNPKDPDSMFKYLRLRGTVPDGSVVTVEPGLYFCEFIIRPFLEDEKHGRFIDKEVLDGYWDVGGVRIEGTFYIEKSHLSVTDHLNRQPLHH